jgi:hypothetical protein
MTETQRHNRILFWKPFLFGVGTPVVARLLQFLLAAPLAWAIVGFAAIMLFHLTPPKTQASLSKVVVTSAAGAVFLFAYLKFVG